MSNWSRLRSVRENEEMKEEDEEEVKIDCRLPKITVKIASA